VLSAFSGIPNSTVYVLLVPVRIQWRVPKKNPFSTIESATAHGEIGFSIAPHPAVLSQF